MTEKKDHPFKSKNMPLAMRLVFSVLSFVFKVLNIVSPKLGGKLALHLFMRPPQVSAPKREYPIKEQADLSTITINDTEIAVWVWEGKKNSDETHKKTILLSHGWAGRTTQFFRLIELLVEKGYRVVGADIPAHGESKGSQTNMVEGSYILAHVGKNFAPLSAVVGHSFGTGTTLLALDKFGLNAPKVALVGAYSRVSFIINLFSEVFNLSPKVKDAMKQAAVDKFGNDYEINWTWENIAPVETAQSYQGDLLFIHDEDDYEVPWHEVDELHKSKPEAILMKTKGLGHRRILRDTDVVNAIADFIIEDH